jgi:predicted phage-related endonuclease
MKLSEATKELATINSKQLEVQSKISQATAQFQGELKSLQEQDRKLRDVIAEAMERNGTKSYEDDYVKLTLRSATERHGLDTKRLKEEEPEVYAKYETITPVKGSVTIKVKGE